MPSNHERPTAQPEAATFLSAGLHLSRSLAVVGERPGPDDVEGRA